MELSSSPSEALAAGRRVALKPLRAFTGREGHRMKCRIDRGELRRDARWLADARGMSLLEMLVVLGIVGVLSVIAIPMSGNAIANFRITGDTRSVSNAAAV